MTTIDSELLAKLDKAEEELEDAQQAVEDAVGNLGVVLRELRRYRQEVPA